MFCVKLQIRFFFFTPRSLSCGDTLESKEHTEEIYLD